MVESQSRRRTKGTRLSHWKSVISDLIPTIDTVPGHVLADEVVIDNESFQLDASNAKALEKSGENPL